MFRALSIMSRTQSPNALLIVSINPLDYAGNVSIDPGQAERKELLKKVHEIPGADWYTSVHLYSFFTQKRKAASRPKVSGEGEVKRGRKRKAESEELTEGSIRMFQLSFG